jgi:4-hydroxybenzoate polyprenyltransferase
LFKLFRQIFRFFVYSNLYIALCAMLMVHQTYSFLLSEHTSRDLLAFVFFATITSYSFHWWLTRHSLIPSIRNEWLKRFRGVHLVLFFIGLAGAGFYFYKLLPYWQWLVFAAIVTFLYSAPKIPHPYFRSLRKVAIGKTIFLAFVWMYVTTVLPIIVSGQSWKPAFLFFIASRFFLIYAICILFDVRDREDDRASGIRSLITWMSNDGVKLLFFFSLALFFISTFLLLFYGYTVVEVILLLIPGTIVALLYHIATRHFSDVLYYFVLDGLMALSAVFMI